MGTDELPRKLDGPIEAIPSVLKAESRARAHGPPRPTKRGKDGGTGLRAERLADRQDFPWAWQIITIEIIEDGDQEGPRLGSRMRPFDLQLYASEA